MILVTVVCADLSTDKKVTRTTTIIKIVVITVTILMTIIAMRYVRQRQESRNLRPPEGSSGEARWELSSRLVVVFQLPYSLLF